MSKRVQSKTWCFTINNYTVEEEFYCMFDLEPIQYICFGHEIGSNGTPHLQGYLEVSYRVDLNVIKHWPGLTRAHLEPRRGTQQQAIDYTKKTDKTDWFETGKKLQQRPGARRDLDDVRLLALEGGMKEVVPWANLQQIRCAEKYLEYCEPKRTWKPTVVWLHGETGSGKSRMAQMMYPNAYVKADNSKWWNGYDGHEEVIWNDFRDSDIQFNYLLNILDRYECRVECKGGMRQFRPKTIIITCHKPPTEMYHGVSSERKDQLYRRIDIVQEVGGVILNPPTEMPEPTKKDEGLVKGIASPLVHPMHEVCSDPNPSSEGPEQHHRAFKCTDGAALRARRFMMKS